MFFRIDEGTGAISLQKTIDYETRKQLKFSVEANDGEIIFNSYADILSFVTVTRLNLLVRCDFV